MTRMTMAMVALAAMPGMLAAQQTQRDTNRTNADSARANMQQQDTTGGAARAGGQHGQMRHQRSGRNAGRNMGLSRDQATQLQEALGRNGCDAGTADGVVGPKTRSAMRCARQQLGVNDNQSLYQSLNLDFAGQGAAGAGGQQEPGAQAVHGDSSQVGGRNQGRVRPPQDTTNPTGDTSAANRARQQTGGDTTGMRSDTTGMRSDSMRMRSDSMRPPTTDSTMSRPTNPRDTTTRRPPRI